MSVDQPLTSTDPQADGDSSSAMEEEKSQPRCLRSRISGCLSNFFSEVPRNLILIIVGYNMFFMFYQIFFTHPSAPATNKRRAIFYFLSSIGMILMSLFVYKRIVGVALRNRTKPWFRNGHRGLSIFGYCWILMAHSFLLFLNIPLPETFFLPVVVFLALGLWLHFFVFSLIFFIIERVTSHIPPLKKYPILTSQTIHTLIAFSLALLLVTEGFISTSQRPTLRKMNVAIKNLPKEFDGFSIALVSDIHVGPTVDKNRVYEIVDVINGVQPDIVTIVGDLVDGYVDYIGKRAKPLTQLRPKYGTFAALGNHEYLHEDVDGWIRFFKKDLNLTMLVNDAVVIKKDGKQLCVAGVDDFITESMHVEGHRMDPEKALRHCPTNATTVMLVHQPNGAARVFKTLPNLKRHVDLILAGHTHAGQMFVTAPITFFSNTFFYGLYYYQPSDSQIYVSSGVNYWGPPLKMFPSLCEIVNIKLRIAKE